MPKLVLYKTQSPWIEDIVKECALTYGEVDNNFLELKGDEIESVILDTDEKTISFHKYKDSVTEETWSTIDLKGLEYVSDITYDTKSLVVTYSNGHRQEFFVDLSALGVHVSTDNTLIGGGDHTAPLGANPASRTAFFRLSKDFIDLTSGETLPTENVHEGDTYITIERANRAGRMYSRDLAMNVIRPILSTTHSEWRIPSKNDWDELLNIMEDSPQDMNHGETIIDAELGYDAGRKLKSNEGWVIVEQPHLDTLTCDCDYVTADAYNCNLLAIMPLGKYSNGAQEGISQKAYYLTTTHRMGSMSPHSVYLKNFQYDCNGVRQEESREDEYYFIRLVKDYTGNNYQEVEMIDGREYQCTLITTDDGKYAKVWMLDNLDMFIDGSIESIDTSEEQLFYTVNTWHDGAWYKTRMNEGDSVTFEKVLADTGSTAETLYTTYRLENGVLIDTESDNRRLIDRIEKIEEDIASMDYSDSTEFNKYVTSIQQQDGQITVEKNFIQVDCGEF